ncbi:hypothetical protein [Streptomyces sp. NPDC058653]
MLRAWAAETAGGHPADTAVAPRLWDLGREATGVDPGLGFGLRAGLA